MKSLSFQQVDVFTSVPLKGNPVAVVLDGDTLSGEKMQSIAAWTNLSETTFVCSPTNQRADYRLRIFTPWRELPFAGHPTIGSAHAMLRGGLKPNTPGRLVQECGRGLVNIKIDLTHSDFRAFRVTIDRVNQGRVAVLNNLIKDSNGELGFSLNTSAFGAGQYLLTIEGLDSRGDPQPDSWAEISIRH